MEWNDTVINDACRKALCEISKMKKGTAEFEKLNDQLLFVFEKQREERTN